MKRKLTWIISIVSLILLALFVTIILFYIGNKGFKKVEIPNTGTIQVPKDWLYYEKDGIIYFVNNDDVTNCYMVGHILNLGEEYSFETPEFSNISISDMVSYICFSNSTFVGTVQCGIDEIYTTKYYIKSFLYEDQYLFLVVLDDTIDYNTIKKIGNSFIRFNQ